MTTRFHVLANATLKEFFFNWTEIPKYIVPDFFLAQIFSGHGSFGEYLNRLKVRDENNRIYSPFCWCDGRTIQTVQHIMIHCPLFEDIRSDGYLGHSGELIGDIDNLRHWIFSEPQFERLCQVKKFIVDRLHEYRDNPHRVPANLRMSQ